MDGRTFFETYITPALAVWGAFLSTILAFRTFKNDRRRLRVSCRIIERSTDDAGNFYGHVLGVSVVNIGHRPISVRHVGIDLDNSLIFAPHNAREFPKL